MEQILQGYCRTLDAARIVLAETDGNTVEADCEFEFCPHRTVCAIGRAIEAMQPDASGR